MTIINFISGRQIHSDTLEINDIKEFIRDQEGIPIKEQIIQPCWGRGGGGRGRGTMCVSMRTMGGGRRGGDCSNHAEQLEEAKNHSSKDSNRKRCCEGGNPSFTFNLKGTSPRKDCTKTFTCSDLGLPSGNKLFNFMFRREECRHLNRDFCNHENNLQIWGKSEKHCKFCMAHDSGCSDSKKFELCAKNKDIGSPYYEECKCINNGPKSDLERKMVEYNGENYACWSNECRSSSMNIFE